MAQWLVVKTCNLWFPCQAWVQIPSRTPLFPWARYFTPNSLVPVGSRNRFDWKPINDRLNLWTLRQV